MRRDGRPRGLDTERLKLEVRRARKPFLALVVLAAVSAGCAAVILKNIGVQLPWSDTYTARVAVDDVSGLVPHAHQVRLSGVEVGRVSEIGVKRGRAIVKIRMDGRYAPLYRDARLRLRPETPLEDFYLNIEDRGTRSAGALGEDDVLSAERTRTPVDIGRVLNVFNADTRLRLEQAIDEYGRGLPDRGRELRATLVELAPFLDAAARLTRETAIRRRRTRRLVHNFRLMTEELARRDTALTRLVGGGAQSLTELGSVDASLERVLAELPPTMRRLQTSFSTLRAAADELDPAFDALRPAARAMPEGLGALRRFSLSAEPSFAALRRPLRDLNRLVRPLRPTAAGLAHAFDELQPLAPRLDRITRKVKPCARPLQKFFHNTISLTKFYDRRAVILRGQTVLAGGPTPQPNQALAPSCVPGGPSR
jgi:ABC-type transporter Mla subunit MlaD